MTQGRAAAIADSVVRGGYASLTLDRLARQVCQVMDVEQSSIVVRDPARAGEAIAVAGCGLDEEAVGSRFDAHKGLTGRVLASGEPVVSREVAPNGTNAGSRSIRAAAPVRWDARVQGALGARTDSPGRRFGPSEIRLLSQLADTVGAALKHAERRAEVLSSVRRRMAALMSAVEGRDPYTAGHSEAVAELSTSLGRYLRLSPADLLELEAAALLHDLGKSGVPDAVLNKPAPLDEDEQALVRRHTVWGAQMLADIPGLEPVGTIVLFHHERWDGTGYPQGLAQSQIPIASRIIAVCDAYHSMTSHRPYRRALSTEHATWELIGAAGSQFDPAVVERFVDTLDPSETPTEGERSGFLPA
jgi:putative nucleotidyltransferase with HDIG domain